MAIALRPVGVNCRTLNAERCMHCLLAVNFTYMCSKLGCTEMYNCTIFGMLTQDYLLWLLVE